MIFSIIKILSRVSSSQLCLTLCSYRFSCSSCQNILTWCFGLEDYHIKHLPRLCNLRVKVGYYIKETNH